MLTDTAAVRSSRLFLRFFFTPDLWPRILQKSALSPALSLWAFWTLAICSALREETTRRNALEPGMCECACDAPGLLSILINPGRCSLTRTRSRRWEMWDYLFPVGLDKGLVPMKSTRSGWVRSTLNVAHSDRLVSRQQTWNPGQNTGALPILPGGSKSVWVLWGRGWGWGWGWWGKGTGLGQHDPRDWFPTALGICLHPT